MDWNSAYKMVKALGWELEEEPIHELTWVCSDCGGFLLEEEIISGDVPRTEDGVYGYCECGGDVFDAHEINQLTPIESWMKLHLEYNLRKMDKKCDEVREYLRELE